MAAHSLRPLERQRTKRDHARKLVEELLAHADVSPQGNRPWDIQVNDERFYNRVHAQGSLGGGESYVDGWWECTSPDQLIFRLLESGAAGSVRPWIERLGELKAKLWRSPPANVALLPAQLCRRFPGPAHPIVAAHAFPARLCHRPSHRPLIATLTTSPPTP